MRRRSIWRPSGATANSCAPTASCSARRPTCRDGGLALAAFEMAEGAGLGVTLDAGDIGQLFGEDQARYLVACPAQALPALAGGGARRRACRWQCVGRFGGDRSCAWRGDRRRWPSCRQLYRSAFAPQLGRQAAPDGAGLTLAGEAAVLRPYSLGADEQARMPPMAMEAQTSKT